MIGATKEAKSKVCRNGSCEKKFVARFPLQRCCSPGCENEVRNAKKSKDGTHSQKTRELGCEKPAIKQGGSRGPEKRPGGIRKTSIRKKSKKQADEERELAEIKKLLIAKYGEKCMSCGKPGPVDLSHLIKRQEKRFVLDPRNLVLQGSANTGTCLCHDHWEVRNFGEVIKFINFDEIMHRIHSMDDGKFWRFVHRFEDQGFKSESLTLLTLE